MNNRDKELAVQCRLITSNIKGIYVDTLQEFADLVRADEREALVEVIQSYPFWIGNKAKEEIAEAIRARGE